MAWTFGPGCGRAPPSRMSKFNRLLAFGNDFFDQVVGVSLSSSNCSSNQYGFNVCEESASFNGADLNAGTYWMTLRTRLRQQFGSKLLERELRRRLPRSPGCPSQAAESALGTIPSESFTILGNAGSTSGYRNHAGARSLLLLARERWEWPVCCAENFSKSP